MNDINDLTFNTLVKHDDTKGKTYIKPDTTNLTNRQLIVDGEVV